MINEVYETLRDAGFEVKVSGESFVVSLNRPINTMEVSLVLIQNDLDATLTRRDDVVVVTF